jgi:putative transcriptional regulator
MRYKCRLRVILAEKEMTHEELRKKVNVGRSTLSQIINNKTLPRFDVAYRIAEALDMRIEEVWVKVK